MKKKFSVPVFISAALAMNISANYLMAAENPSMFDIKFNILNKESYNSTLDLNNENKVDVFDVIRSKMENGRLPEDTGSTSVNLNNEYVTQYGEPLGFTYPSFFFNYPDNWKITSEKASMIDGEFITLESDSGVVVKYTHYGNLPKDFNFTPSAASMTRIEDEVVAPSQFVPSWVSGTDYSGLVEFAVIRAKATGYLNMLTDSEFTDIDGASCYAIYPKSEVGKKTESRLRFQEEYTFWYSGHISFIGYVDGREMTETEKNEVIAILGSFRNHR